MLFPYEKHLYHWTSTHKKSYHEMFFSLITKSFWGFFASNLGPDCSINSHKLTYNSHCSSWRWYHTCARFISVFPWKYISRSYGRIWHASFFPAMLYTSVVRVTLHPIPIPSFPIIPSLRQGDVHQFGACFRATHNVKPWKFPREKTAVLHGGGFNLLVGNIRNIHSITVLGTSTYPLPMALLKMIFLLSKVGYVSSLEGI